MRIAWIGVCAALAAHGVESSGRQVFNVADYGARRDGSASATDAFRKAIQAARAAGGGTIFVPAGKYTSRPIELFSNMTLDLDAGATIRRGSPRAIPMGSSYTMYD